MENSGEETKTIETWCRTKFEEQTFTHIWVIDQFPLWVTEIAKKNEESSTFTTGEHTWCLQLNPKHTHENENYLSFFLKPVQSPKSKVFTEYTLGILDGEGESIFVMEMDHRLFKFGEQESWGLPEFITIDSLLDEENEYLSNDTLTLFCEVKILDPSSVSGSGSYTALGSQPKVIVPESHLLTSNFQSFFKSGHLSDVKLVVEGEEIPSHKLILSAVSPVFEAMFQHDMKEKNENRVEIKDIEASVFEEFLNFIYAGQVNNLEKNAEALLVVAERFGIERLKALCEESLASQLSVENIVHVHELANLHNANQLKAITIKFFKENFDDVTNSDRFLSLMLQEMALTEKDS